MVRRKGHTPDTRRGADGHRPRRQLFAYQQYGIEPDIMTLAKGLGSGVPIGAFMAKEHASVFMPGEHGSTFGGNPLVCAAAYAAVKYMIENKTGDHVVKAGKYLFDGLEKLEKKYDFIADVRGRGLLLAMSFKEEIAEELVNQCLEQGLLLNMVKPNALRFMPPLIVTEKDIDKALDILDKVLKARKANG